MNWTVKDQHNLLHHFAAGCMNLFGCKDVVLDLNDMLDHTFFLTRCPGFFNECAAIVFRCGILRILMNPPFQCYFTHRKYGTMMGFRSADIVSLSHESQESWSVEFTTLRERPIRPHQPIKNWIREYSLQYSKSNRYCWMTRVVTNHKSFLTGLFTLTINHCELNVSIFISH